MKSTKLLTWLLLSAFITASYAAQMNKEQAQFEENSELKTMEKPSLSQMAMENEPSLTSQQEFSAEESPLFTGTEKRMSKSNMENMGLEGESSEESEGLGEENLGEEESNTFTQNKNQNLDFADLGFNSNTKTSNQEVEI